MNPAVQHGAGLREDNWRAGLFGSALLHALVVAVGVFWGFWNWGPRDPWGDPNANPGAGFAVTPVDRIPVPSRAARSNPLAEDSDFDVDRAKANDRDRDRQEKEKKDAIELDLGEKQRKEQQAASRYKYRSSEELERLRSTVGQAASNPMYGTIGAGGVGIGTGTPFGNRFGYYTDLLRRRISEKWRTGDVDPVIRTAKPAVIRFDILRNGTVRNVQVVQSSGVPTLDYSARRAVLESAPLPELPREFDRESVNVEFTFQLQR